MARCPICGCVYETPRGLAQHRRMTRACNPPDERTDEERWAAFVLKFEESFRAMKKYVARFGPLDPNGFEAECLRDRAVKMLALIAESDGEG